VIPPSPRSVLVVDDDALTREWLRDVLDAENLRIECASDAESALESCTKNEFDVVLTDIQMPGRTGVELLSELHERCPDTPILMITAFASVQSAVDSLRCGAFDYLIKPLRREMVVAAVRRALRLRELECENAQLLRAVDDRSSFGDLIGSSQAMREIYHLIRKVADRECNLLITGESGTGKEVVARTIHLSGKRSQGPFVPINCASMPAGLLESELFGHVKGAFSGAHSRNEGLVAAADGGTLFLDEIGEMSPELQGKLLRVLQDRSVRPVGGVSSRKLDVRVIAATHRDLRAEVRNNRFRMDLYYRLHVVNIRIPPLRERKEDIPLLANEFLRRHGGEDHPELSGPALRSLLKQPWTGNARELENTIERALALCDGKQIQPRHLHLPRESAVPCDGGSDWLSEALRQRLSVRELTDRYIDRVLSATGGRKTDASRILGLNRRTLYRWQLQHRDAEGEGEALCRHE